MTLFLKRAEISLAFTFRVSSYQKIFSYFLNACGIKSVVWPFIPSGKYSDDLDYLLLFFTCTLLAQNCEIKKKCL
jgi:hypothetical protein